MSANCPSGSLTGRKWKAGLYETICKEPDGFRLLAELQSMELEPDLLGALTELITAQI